MPLWIRFLERFVGSVFLLAAVTCAAIVGVTCVAIWAQVFVLLWERFVL